MQTCPNCGEENPDRFRLCGICGAALAPAPPPQEVRKTVTIVFCDLKGSTNLGESLDTERVREVLNVYFNEMKSVLERHGGTVEKFIGDAVMAVFGLPRLHEDDALRAVRAALEMQSALSSLNDRLEAEWGVRLENRTGVNTGEVVAGDVAAGQRLVTGDAVNVAARLEQAAPSMEILIGEPTFRLVRDAVDVEPVDALALKGKAEPVPAYRLLGVTRGEGVARRLDAPIVGRAEELAALRDALARAEVSHACQMVTVFGPAGVGKSRLLMEFTRIAAEGRSLQGRCLPYGDGITYWPLAEVTREAAGIGDDDPLEVARSKLASLLPEAQDVAERIGAAIGVVPGSFPVEETFWAARHLLEHLARPRPLIVFVDDIHWAEPTFLDLLRHVAETAVAPLVLLCSARQELLEEHPEWGETSDGARALHLERLSDDESAHVIENLLGTTAIDESVRKQLIGAAEGNPLFVEQMLSMLIDDGILRRDEEGRWVPTSDLSTVAIPPTISALLTARLDRLPPDERTVLERGSVVGQLFHREAVEQLSPETIRDGVGACLLSLAKKELVRPDDPAAQQAFRFTHVLIRDAAYGGLLKRTRAELHEAFVDWSEGTGSDRVTEYEEIRGYHLEQAYLIRADLGTLDDHARELGARGAGYLGSAGRRALARGDMPAAANLLERAATLLGRTERKRLELLLDLGEALMELGEFARAEEVLSGTIETARLIEDLGLQMTASVVRLQLHYTTNPQEDAEEVLKVAEGAVQFLEEAGDRLGLAKAWRLIGHVHGAACRYGEAERAARLVVEHARLAGDRPLEMRSLAPLALCAVYGPTPVPEAVHRCEQLLAAAGGDRKAEAMLMCALAHLYAMEGSFDRARELYRRSRGLLEDLGFKLLTALTSLDSGSVEMLAGDPVAAEDELRRDYEALAAMGEKNYISTTAALLAHALYEQGRFDEADDFASTSASVAAEDDVESQILWRAARGKVLARRGRFEEGEALLREALELIRRTDEPDSQGNALMDLAEVLVLADRPDEARSTVAEALGLFELKGNVVSARRARGLAALTGAEGVPADPPVRAEG